MSYYDNSTVAQFTLIRQSMTYFEGEDQSEYQVKIQRAQLLAIISSVRGNHALRSPQNILFVEEAESLLSIFLISLGMIFSSSNK